jgi:hypothetical protein
MKHGQEGDATGHEDQNLVKVQPLVPFLRDATGAIAQPPAGAHGMQCHAQRAQQKAGENWHEHRATPKLPKQKM